MAKLTYKQRKELPDSDFAMPEKRDYPIEDIEHARNALARVSQFGTLDEQRQVRLEVYKRYPELIPAQVRKVLKKSMETKPLNEALAANTKNYLRPRAEAVYIKLPIRSISMQGPPKVQVVNPAYQPVYIRNIGRGNAASRRRIKRVRR